MIINEIKIFRVDLPLAIPFHHHSSGVIDTLQEVVAAIRTDSGVVGYGEVRGNSPYLTGDTPGRVVSGVSYLARFLLGESLENFASLTYRIQNAIVGNSGAKAVLDIALYDTYAKCLGIAVNELLGGRLRNRLPTDVDISFGSSEDVAAETRCVVREGYTVVKVRVGMDLQTDGARLSAIREAIDGEPLGHRVTLAADANGAWHPKEAIKAVRGWEKYRIAFIEQPVPGDDVEGLRYVRENIGIPVMADESVHGIKDVFRLVESRAVDMFHFKSNKAGGLTPLRNMMAIAEVAGISYMMGQTTEGMIASAAAAHAGAASVTRYFEVNSDRRIASQPFRGLEIKEGNVMVPRGPGLGVEVDESVLKCIDVIKQ